MCEKIFLVRNDTRPSLEVTITDEVTGAAIDVTGATVLLKFRAVGASTLTSTLTAALTTPGSGVVTFDWADDPTALAGDAGDYEGEVEITFVGGSVQTVYTPLRFYLREDF